MTPLLHAGVASSRYGAVEVLHEVTVDVGEGEIVAVLGGNGAGKTTLLRTISGVSVRASAEITLDGRDISRLPAAQRVRAGVVHVPEGRRVFTDLTVGENLQVAAHARRLPAGEAQAALDQVFGLFPILAERRQQRATSLSGGQQQMLAIGRGLMSRPRLLLVDEASLGLSPALTKTVFSVMDRINADGVTVVLVEQNIGVLPHADRALIMEKGTLVYQGSGDEIHSASLRETYLGTPA